MPLFRRRPGGRSGWSPTTLDFLWSKCGRELRVFVRERIFCIADSKPVKVKKCLQVSSLPPGLFIISNIAHVSYRAQEFNGSFIEKGERLRPKEPHSRDIL